jgi:hypothetical protein
VTDADIDNEMGGMSIASVNIMNRIVAPVLGPIQQVDTLCLEPIRTDPADPHAAARTIQSNPHDERQWC